MHDTWVKISSWHILRTWTRVPNRGVTLCGRTATMIDEALGPPSDEKTCETCFRLREHRTTDEES
jgi:hypothetical protein